MTRRDKGDGSVYQRSNGRYVGEYTDANGKRRYVSGKNKPEVKAKLKEAIKNKEEGVSFDASKLTFGDYLDQWLASTKDTVGLRTYQRAEIAVRVHIKPKLGRVRLDKLTALQLDGLYRDKLKFGLSPRSVRIIHATVHKALRAHFKTATPGACADRNTPKIGEYLLRSARPCSRPSCLQQGFEMHS